MSVSNSILVRAFNRETDEAFVFSTWLKNYKYSSYFAKRIKPSVFFKGHRAVIEHILSKLSNQVLVAHPKDDSDTILGWLCFEPRANSEERHIIHYVFVKDAFRKMGVAKSLLESAEIDINAVRFTHWAYPVDEIIQKYEGMIFDPYAL